ncbi:GroES-like protein [Lentithecium fluviatile CBS 122367]|uniref:GroES-like protein n=1 Tax=Lentithecium fluviatile CBS 122367 TaxID=1168545 RepID=A0A6G1IR50_9PLEO|nr:GroES-like protein [Lentithecium fluviatile CBS 122367]
MKAVVVESLGAPAQVRSDIDVPEPSDTQILVKCIYTAMNPVDAFMVNTGRLVDSWPLVPGGDAAGIVMKTGKDAYSALGPKFKEGDEVFGCVRLGVKGHGAWQEHFLFDAPVTIPKPKNINFAQAATTGAGILTAFEGAFDVLKLPLLDPDNLPEAKDEWALVFGGAGTVGKFAVQTLKLSGFRVVTTCSAKSFELLSQIGADATIDYSKPEAEVISEIKAITNGNLNLAFDAVSVNNNIVAMLFPSLPTTSSTRLYATTNDWDPLPDASLGFKSMGIELGPIGRPDAKALNERIHKYIPVVYKLLESGKLKVGEYIEEGSGVEGILKAWEMFNSGKAGSKKVVVKIADV